MTNQQAPVALRLAEELEHDPGINRPSVVAELRRLHAENTTLQQGYDAARMEIDGLRDRVQDIAAMLRENRNRRIMELEAQLDAIGAGGVEPLRPRKCLHQISEPADASEDQHPDDAAVDALAAAMKAKLAKQRARGYGGWDTPECTQQRLSDMLRGHVDKGDPADVANFCAFLAARGEGIAPKAEPQADSVTAPAAKVIKRGANRQWMSERLGHLPDGIYSLYLAPPTQAAPAAQGDAEDAARYRWLRRKVSAHGICDGWQFGFPTALSLPAPAEAMRDPAAGLDAAIDAARAQANEGQSHD